MNTCDNIIVISPGYLRPFREMVSGFQKTEFYVCSSFQWLENIIEQIPIQYTIGLCYLNNSLGKQNLQELRKYIQLLSRVAYSMERRIVVTIALQKKRIKKDKSTALLRAIVKEIENQLLEVYLVDFTVVTDVVIRTQVIGSILAVLRPIELREYEKINYNNHTHYRTKQNLKLENIEYEEKKDRKLNKK